MIRGERLKATGEETRRMFRNHEISGCTLLHPVCDRTDLKRKKEEEKEKN